MSLCLWVLANKLQSIPIGDRIAYYVSRHSDQVSVKISTQQQTSHHWQLEETFYAFEKPVDYCIPITVYSHPTNNGHGITQYGHQDILFWFFAYDTNELNHQISTNTFSS